MRHSKRLSVNSDSISKRQHRVHKPVEPQVSKTDISKLFASSKHRAGDSGISSPLKKRPRLEDGLNRNGGSALCLIKEQDMYSFSATNPRSNGIVDLTGSSPNGSPKRASPIQRRTSLGTNPLNSTAHLGAKQLVVKNLKKKTKTDPNKYYDQVWDQLDASLSAIFDQKLPPYPWEELYKGAENVCRQDKAPVLHQKLYERCRDNVSGHLKQPLVVAASHGPNTKVLQAVIEAWSVWKKQLTEVRSIFYYMDRSYLLHSSAHTSIEEMGVALFRGEVFSDSSLEPKILNGACDLLSLDRKRRQDAGAGDLFRQTIDMFHALSVYSKDFEPKMLEDSVEFFRDWTERQLSSTTLAEYLDASQDLFEAENCRCDTFNLGQTTRSALVTDLEDILIETQAARLVNIDDVSYLMQHDKTESLRKLYSLLQRVRLGEKLRPAFGNYITSQGAMIVFDEQREDDMVVRLLNFKKRLDNILEMAFDKHEGLGHTLREAFEAFINKPKKSNMTWGTDNPKPGEMIAKYVDMILKGGAQAIPSLIASNSGLSTALKDEDIENEDVAEDEDVHINRQLDQVLDLFRFVHGKAVFEAFYKRDLARRLLMARSASADAEKSMLTRLKSECGAAFTHNLEQMFKDIELGREEITSYKMMLEERQRKPAIDLNVSVLSASAWPTYPDDVVSIPMDIQKATGEFEDHYKTKHTGRRLHWKHSLAHCQLKATFPKRQKELVVSAFQAIVLLLFNDKPGSEPLTYAEIQAATSLVHPELKRTLQSLACARYRVLTKSPKGRDVDETDTFTVNHNFDHPKYRIKINTIQLKETKEENKETHERVAADRHYETQAAIVRIMKSRKTIRHAELVAEVIKATKSRGVLDPADIKKNIEKLIEKDYMEREEGNVYSYLA